MNSRIIILCFMLVVGIAVFGTNTLVKEIHSQNTKIKQLDADIKQGELALDNLKKVNETIAARQADIDLMELALPSHAAIPEVLVMLEDLYQAEGFQPNSVSFSTTAEGSAEVPTSIAGTSTYRQLFSVFNKIQANIRPVLIKSFSSSGTEDDNISSSFTLSFPFAAAPAATTSAGAGAQDGLGEGGFNE